MWRAHPVEVGDVAVVEPRVPLLRPCLGRGRAIALVALAHGTGGRHAPECGMDGAQHGMVTDDVIGGVEAGVAKPLML
eukprot:6390774-Prymnesium_polylepis.1